MLGCLGERPEVGPPHGRVDSEGHCDEGPGAGDGPEDQVEVLLPLELKPVEEESFYRANRNFYLQHRLVAKRILVFTQEALMQVCLDGPPLVRKDLNLTTKDSVVSESILMRG